MSPSDDNEGRQTFVAGWRFPTCTALAKLILLGFIAGMQLNSMRNSGYLTSSFGNTNVVDTKTHTTLSGGKQPPKGRQTIPLSDLTNANGHVRCNTTGGIMFWRANQVAPLDASKQIPNIVHQTSKSRCLWVGYSELTQHWTDLANYSYYLHDDEAVWKLIHREDGWPEFPHLQQTIQCANSMTAVSDIWRYLVLWEYGGIYSDLDSVPNSWTPDYVLPEDDAMFVVEHYDAPSQYWMAVSPKHPILYFAVHHALAKLLAVQEVGTMDAALVTGPFALLDALTWFMRDVGISVGKPVVEGLYQGRYNRTVRIIGQGRQKSNRIITRDKHGPQLKKKIYNHHMNMTHFSQMQRTWRAMNRTCLSVFYDVTIGPPPGFIAGHIGVDQRSA
jgi:mannosyltransferase OCH1-like enzyme